ncbi:hypothetical protein CRE_04252 [Caenorhabditis remanei]|uniref:Uncharacterized protein n=1 Tax=Caenorhabditis remanei TaxID=31234 RepID=E3N677_CAERE|nr:hypothetical protein CRE_04252 [Caenorhabditis remanei]
MSSSILILSFILSVLEEDQAKKPKLERKDQKLANHILALLQQHEDGELEVSQESMLTNDGEEPDNDWNAASDESPNEKMFNGIDTPNVVIFGNVLVTIEQVWEAVQWFSLPSTARNGKNPTSRYWDFPPVQENDKNHNGIRPT